jgi:putative nucleotidyltransferase with HDIG domain
MLGLRQLLRLTLLLVAAGSFVLIAPRADAADTAAGKMRAVAWDALRARVHDQAHLNHSLAVEAITREMAAKTDDADQWALAGLLHDIDIGTTASDLSRHGTVGAAILRDLGMSEAVIHAVAAHDDHSGTPRTSRLDHAVYCADQIYWLIADAGVAFPSDKLRTVTSDWVWQQILAMPAKATVVGKVSNECASIGLTMPQALEAALSGLRKAALRADVR